MHRMLLLETSFPEAIIVLYLSIKMLYDLIFLCLSTKDSS